MNIAIIGMSGRYPGAENINELHKVLLEKEDHVKKVSDSRRKLLKLDEDAEYQEIGFIEDIECFDNEFFNISPKEAVNMSPEQRISLELAANAILDGGYSLAEMKGKNCGVFVASQDNDYYSMLSKKSGLSWIGSMKSIIPGRIAYTFDLHGPNVVLDTGCSSVLTGLDDACLRLNSGDIDYALVGGVTVYLQFGKKNTDGDLLGIEAGNGRCKPFDAKADGIGVGEGGGFILIKRKEDAIRDKDYIYATIKATALSGDGTRCTSMTTPGIEGQMEAIERAWKKSGLDINCLTELEAHGTGTRLGDPIEVESFEESYRKMNGGSGREVHLTSIKGNIGHLNANAGIAGIEKVILGFENNVCYPICGYESPNPFIDFDEGVLRPADKIINFDVSERRVAGINSFGLSGSNAHVIIENNIDRFKEKSPEKEMLIKLSAKSEESLREYIEDVKSYIEKNGVSKNLIGTLNVGRDDYRYRSIVKGRTAQEFVEALKNVTIASLDKKNLKKKFPDVSATDELIETLYLDGYEIDWKEYSGDYNKVPAPNYHFDKHRFWGEIESLSDNLIENDNKNIKEASGSIEDRLKKIWVDALECESEEVENDTDFFDLGGNSLLIAILVDDIKAVFDVDIPVDDIYEFGTLKEQADIIREKSGKTEEKHHERVELLPMQKLILNSVKNDKDSSKWNLNVSFKLEGKTDIDRLKASFMKLCGMHEIITGRIVSIENSDYIQVGDILQEEPVSVIYGDDEGELKKMLDKEALRPIDVFNERMTKMFIYVADEENAYLLLKASHLIADGWTLNLIFEELCGIYSGKIEKTADDHYADYVIREKEMIKNVYAKGEVSAVSDKSKKLLKDKKYTPDTKCVPPEYVIVGNDRFEKLKVFAKENKLSMFQVTLSVYHASIQEYLKTDSSSVAIMQANRSLKEYRNTAGLFAKTVLTDTESKDVKEIISDMKKQTGVLIKNQVISLGDNITADKNKFEDFVDFMITYQNFNNGNMELDGIHFLPNMISGSEAVCPMTILFFDTDSYLMGTVQYSPEYFSREDAKRFIEVYQNKTDELIG